MKGSAQGSPGPLGGTGVERWVRPQVLALELDQIWESVGSLGKGAGAGHCHAWITCPKSPLVAGVGDHSTNRELIERLLHARHHADH